MIITINRFFESIALNNSSAGNELIATLVNDSFDFSYFF